MSFTQRVNPSVPRQWGAIGVSRLTSEAGSDADRPGLVFVSKP
jgi:hypothetical protein